MLSRKQRLCVPVWTTCCRGHTCCLRTVRYVATPASPHPLYLLGVCRGVCSRCPWSVGVRPAHPARSLRRASYARDAAVSGPAGSELVCKWNSVKFNLFVNHKDIPGRLGARI